MSSLTYVAGHTGLIGSAVMDLLVRRGETPLTASRTELHLTDQQAVEEFFRAHRPERVYLLAGRVGGIKANSTKPVEFFSENVLIATNVMLSAALYGTRRLIFPASACMYPKQCPQPITPAALWSGPPEESSLPFATAKLAGCMLAQSLRRQHELEFLTVVPATCYGPGDRFSDEGHVVGSMMARMHRAKERSDAEFVIWGSGQPRREFIYSTDVARAMLQLMDAESLPSDEIIHIGSGEEVSMLELAQRMAEAVGYRGQIRCDASRPDGMPRRLLDSGPMRKLGWKPEVPLAQGLKLAYDWYCRHGLEAAP